LEASISISIFEKEEPDRQGVQNRQAQVNQGNGAQMGIEFETDENLPGDQG
jgi:hypothetical protein